MAAATQTPWFDKLIIHLLTADDGEEKMMIYRCASVQREEELKSSRRYSKLSYKSKTIRIERITMADSGKEMKSKRGEENVALIIGVKNANQRTPRKDVTNMKRTRQPC